MAYVPSRGQFSGRNFENRGAYRVALALAKAAKGERSSRSSSTPGKATYSPARGPLQGIFYQTRQQYRNALAQRLGFRNAYEQRKLVTSSELSRALATYTRGQGKPVTKGLLDRMNRGRAWRSSKDGSWMSTNTWFDHLIEHEDKGDDPLWYH